MADIIPFRSSPQFIRNIPDRIQSPDFLHRLNTGTETSKSNMQMRLHILLGKMEPEARASFYDQLLANPPATAEDVALYRGLYHQVLTCEIASLDRELLNDNDVLYTVNTLFEVYPVSAIGFFGFTRPDIAVYHLNGIAQRQRDFIKNEPALQLEETIPDIITALNSSFAQVVNPSGGQRRSVAVILGTLAESARIAEEKTTARQPERWVSRLMENLGDLLKNNPSLSGSVSLLLDTLAQFIPEDVCYLIQESVQDSSVAISQLDHILTNQLTELKKDGRGRSDIGYIYPVVGALINIFSRNEIFSEFSVNKTKEMIDDIAVYANSLSVMPRGSREWMESLNRIISGYKYQDSQPALRSIKSLRFVLKRHLSANKK